MRPLLIASLFALSAAASASVPAPSPATSAPSADPKARALQLLRAIRVKAQSGDGDEAALRAELGELQAGSGDARGRDLVSLAGSYLDLLDAGKPLPPPSPEELSDASDDGADVDEDPVARAAAVARAKAAADARDAAQKTAAMLDQVSGAATNPTTAAAASFDGAQKRSSLPVEVEPASGYHTVNADDYLTQPDDLSRQSALVAATAELLAKAGRKDVGGKHAAALAFSIAWCIEQNPVHAMMVALRLRVRPDGQVVIVYRLSDGAVVEEALGMTLDDGSSRKTASVRGKRKRKRRGGGGGSGDDAGGGGADGGKTGHAKVPDAPDFGGGGDAGAIGSGGGGRGGAAGDAMADAAAMDDGGAGDGVRSGGVVDPDGAPSGGRARGARGGAGAPAPSVSVPSGFTTASGPGDDGAPGAGASADALAEAAPGSKRAARGGGGSADDIPPLTRLSGDLAGGRGAAAGAAPAGVPAAATARANSAAPNAVASAAPARATPSVTAPVYDAQSDGPLRDALAASPATAPPSAGRTRVAGDASPQRSSAVPLALLFGSAALGGFGLFLQNSKS